MQRVYKKLIVSCQALPEEPLHSPYIMGKMALAAKEGGACGIRANTKIDIEEIKKNVDLPIIGIVKKDYLDSKVYITPTIKEVEELISVGVDVIALDATNDIRPGNTTLDELFYQIRKKYPNQKLMADCSTIFEALHADELGFDFIGTTLVGYTKQSEGDKIEADDFLIMRDFLDKVKAPIIGEGNIDSPQKAKYVLDLGCYSVVVGGSITRPQLITKKYSQYIENL